MKLRPKTLSISFLTAIILLGGCAGCGQKTSPQAPIDAPQQFSKTPGSEQSSDGSPIADPILDVELQRIKLPPDHNPYYGKSYFGITENNQKPSPPNEFYNDPLFWIPGWKIRTERYPNGDGESFLVLPQSQEREAHRKRLTASIIEKQGGPLTEAQKREIGEIIFAADGLSNLHVAKYFAAFGSRTSSTALLYAEKAHEENPDDFHTLWVLAYLQMVQTWGRSSDPDAPHNTRTVDSYRRLIEMNPNVARLHYEFATVTPNRDERIAANEKSFLLDPTLYHGKVLRALAINHMGWAHEKAVRYLKQWNVIFPSEFKLKMIEHMERTGGMLVGHHSH